MTINSTSNTNGVNGASANSASLPTLEDLIAKYGDSSNTTWVEDKFQVWRHEPTGAAQGYAISKEFCIIWGNPLCETSQYPEVTKAFLAFIGQKGWKPIWACANDALEKFLAEEQGWRAVMCVQEDGLDPTTANPEANKEVRKHIRAAEKKGCKIVEESGVPTEEVQKEIDEVIRQWKAGRNGTQVHTTNVEPWRDTEHRKYFYARDAEGQIVGFLFIAKVAKGWAIKDCISIPKAPKNVTEWLITSAIYSLRNNEEHYLTFGPTPAEKLAPADNVKSSSVGFLAKTYSGIEKAFLGNKREFRRKFEVDGEPIFVCYPEHGLGRHGISALMGILTD